MEHRHLGQLAYTHTVQRVFHPFARQFDDPRHWPTHDKVLAGFCSVLWFILQVTTLALLCYITWAYIVLHFVPIRQRRRLFYCL